MIVFFWILSMVIALYGLLILALGHGWRRLHYKVPPSPHFAFISVVVAARNEAANIGRCLEWLASQDYPASHFEVILVDDHSEDQTYAIIQEFIQSKNLSNFFLIDKSSLAGQTGKKNALSAAISLSRGDFILCSDADCHGHSQWLRTMNNWLQHLDPHMLIGPVLLWPAGSLFSRMQILEFSSLSGTTGGAARLGYPLMCNGANLLFKKESFLAVGGYYGNLHLASGDDMFLLQKLFCSGYKRIFYLMDPRAIVRTPPVDSLKGFFRQRIRWASKTTAYSDRFSQLVAALVASCNILILLAMILLFFVSTPGAFLLLASLLLKALVDFSLLWPVLGFFKKRKLLWFFPLLFLLYPLYVSFTAIMALIPLKRNWK